MRRSTRIPIAVFVFLARTVFADELLDRYEGDLLPYDPAVGWLIANPCDDGCHESL